MQLANFEYKLNSNMALEIIEHNRRVGFYSKQGTLIMPTEDGSFVEERCLIMGDGTPYLTATIWNPKNFTVEGYNPYLWSGALLMTLDAETGAVLRHNETKSDLENKDHSLRCTFGAEDDKPRPYVKYHC